MSNKELENKIAESKLGGGKKRINAGNKIVPKPKPEKNVKIDAIKAVKGMIKYSIRYKDYVLSKLRR